MSGWQPMLTYDAEREVGRDRGPHRPRRPRARSMPHANRSGSAPSANVIRSAVRALKSITFGPRGGDVERHLAGPRRVEPPDPALAAVDVDRAAGEVGLQSSRALEELGDRHRRQPEMEQGGVAAAGAEHEAPAGDLVAPSRPRSPSAAGCRVCTLVTPVASWICSVAPATEANTTNGSGHRFCESVNVMPSQPAASARRARSAAPEMIGTDIVHSSTGRDRSGVRRRPDYRGGFRR